MQRSRRGKERWFICKGIESHCLLLCIAVLITVHPSLSKATLAEVLPLLFEIFQTSAVGSLKSSSPPCRIVVRLTLRFFLMHCHGKSWPLLQSFQEHDHQFSNDNAVYGCQDKLLGTKCDESATLSKWLHCPRYYWTVCYQSIWETSGPICNHSPGTYISLQTAPLQSVLVILNLPFHELLGVKVQGGSGSLWTPLCFVQKCFIIDKRTPFLWRNWATNYICDKPPVTFGPFLSWCMSVLPYTFLTEQDHLSFHQLGRFSHFSISFTACSDLVPFCFPDVG